jgi:hypothetical protein
VLPLIKLTDCCAASRGEKVSVLLQGADLLGFGRRLSKSSTRRKQQMT